MFFTDREKAIHEMLRVMVPGGRCAVAVWDAIENIAPFAALVALLDRISGKAAGDALRAPFVLGDQRALARCSVALEPRLSMSRPAKARLGSPARAS